jgi:hypothetical protein
MRCGAARCNPVPTRRPMQAGIYLKTALSYGPVSKACAYFSADDSTYYYENYTCSDYKYMHALETTAASISCAASFGWVLCSVCVCACVFKCFSIKAVCPRCRLALCACPHVPVRVRRLCVPTRMGRWVWSWALTFPRTRGRGLSLQDPDFFAIVLLVVPSIMYVVYNAEILTDYNRCGWRCRGRGGGCPVCASERVYLSACL